jgi:cobalt-zinc-cadmium efflux system membrane fusion protein
MMTYPQMLRRVILAIPAVIIVAALFLIGPFKPSPGVKPAAETAEGAVPSEPPQAVDLSEALARRLKVEPIAMRDFEVFKTSVGTINFNENMQVQVFSQYQGKIIRAFYNVGDDVRQGDILFTIDSPDLLQAESTLLAAAGVLELQKRTLARLTGLVKAGGTAQKDVDQAASDQQTAEGNFKAAKDAVRIFGRTDDEIEQILSVRRVESTLKVASPISGRIVTRNAAPGLLTQPGVPPPPFEVADVETMWMIANVIETDAPAYKLGQDVDVSVLAYPDKVFKGHVTNLGSTIDPNSRRQLVRSEIDDPEHLLRSGMFASFRIRVGGPIRSLAVPSSGVIREGDGTMKVWMTADRRRFSKRTVNVGIEQDGWSQILDGLQPGETVVTEGSGLLNNILLTGREG